MKLFGKIGRRLLGWFLLVALIPLLFMGYQGYYFARQAVQREVFLHMEAIAQSKKHAIEQWIGEREHECRVLAANPGIASRDALPDQIRAVIEAFRNQSPEYAAVAIKNFRPGDVRPKYLLSVPEDSVIPEPADHSSQVDWLYRPLKIEGLSRVYLAPNLGAAVTIWQPVMDSLNNLHRVLLAEVLLQNSLNPIILDTTGLGHTGQAYLVDADKVMLTPSRFMSHPAPLSHTMDTEGIRRALSGSSGSGVYRGFEGHNAHGGFEGQEVIGAWAFLPEQRWALIAEMNADEAFAPLAVLRRNAIIVALLTLAAIAIVVAWISRSISSPIRQLAEASLDVSRGNLDRSVAVHLKDEIGELAERFNSMVRSMKESRRQLVQSERLAAIGELVASVVHEIRNPLSAVKMNLRILEAKCASDPVTAEQFEIARTQAERLEVMLAELLDYSKPVALNKQVISSEQLIRDSIRDFEATLQGSEANVVINVSSTSSPLSVDPERMRQVLVNLLLNAQQASEAGKKVEILAERFSEDEANFVRIKITDQGRGISEENLKHIFEPFFTTRKQGTGLGLANARKIVEAHGGYLVVKSRENEGTTVQAILPAGEKP